MMEPHKPNPYDSAGFFSRITFWWLHPLLITGWKRQLEEKDLYIQPNDDDSEHLGNLLQKEWNIEVKKKNPSLLKCIIRIFLCRWVILFPVVLFQECFVLIIQAYLIGVVIDFFQYKLEENEHYAYLSAGGIFISTLLYMITFHLTAFCSQRLDAKLSVACCSVIYGKALKLSQMSLGTSNIGQMVNLLSNDVNKFQIFFQKSFYLVTGPIQIIVMTVLLWQYLGYSTLSGVSLILIYFPLQIGMGKIFSMLRIKTAKLSDKRIHLLNEMLDGMRIIKMYTWEIPFASSIEKTRKKEVGNIKKSLLLYGIPYTMSFILSKLILFVSFFTFVITGGKLTATVAFVATSLSLNLYRSMFHMVPQAISQIAEALISLKRIQGFLLLEERKNITEVGKSRPCINECGIWMTQVFTSWNKESGPTLKSITLNAEPGELLVIVGPIGSGKTSLLMTMLEELPISSGKVKVKGKVSYASQEPWIFSETIKENILLGDVYHEKNYKEVLKVTALEKDINDFPEGDLTLVGERGRIMSGGQKARINLARALYQDADIYILDDPLSSVDAPIAKHIFEKCIMEYLKEKIRILVTHQTQFLKAANKIIVLKEGKIEATGNYKDLMNLGIDLGIKHEKSETYKESDVISEIFPNTCVNSSDERFDPKSIQDFKKAKDIKQEANEAIINNSKKVFKEKEDKLSRRAIAYKDYVNVGIGKIYQFSLLILFIITQVLINGSDYWVVIWTNQDSHFLNENKTFEDYESTLDENNEMNCANKTISYENEMFYMFVYTGLISGLLLSSLITAIAYLTMCTKSSINLHNNMLHSVLRTSISFLEGNNIGKVLNRFSSDMGIIDQQFPIISLSIVNTFINNIGMFVVQTFIYPFLIIPSAILLVLTNGLWIFFMRTVRDIKRLEGKTRSPIFSHLRISLYGVTTIRTSKTEKKFEMAFHKYQNKNTSCKFLYYNLCHWNVEKAFLCCLLNLGITIVLMFFVSSSVSGAQRGLCISYGLSIFLTLVKILYFAVDLESQLTSVERVIDYSNLSSEGANVSPLNKRPSEDWPHNGVIEFKDVSLQYSKGKHPVLKNLNFKIRNGEKVGIVGRTGAGKTSIISALFRMTEPIGNIFIDGINIKEIGLHELRSKLSIIPQDPLLFSGTLQKNIDPFNQHNEATLWKVLEDVHLKDVIRNLKGGLDTELSEGGINFSVGQRQLICLARAMLNRNKILILDEATANVDKETDSLIQQTIREKFHTSTILTIAHRLQTIIDSDRILVLHDGRIEDFDEPYKLLNKQQGIFYDMAKMTGEVMTKRLCSTAEELFLQKRRNRNILCEKL